MELQLIMDASAETFGAAMWLANSSPPSYQLSDSRDSTCNPGAMQQQAPISYPSSQDSLCQDKQDPLKCQLRSTSASPPRRSSNSTSANIRNLPPSNLKRRLVEPLQLTELETKQSRRDGSTESNGSGQGWTTQVEELAEHFATDFDGSLSALAASDLATAVSSYNMSEALLSLPSLTVFKQEAPSPENQQNSTNLNHVSQRTVSTLTTANNAGTAEADSNDNGQAAASLRQLLYASNEEYSPTSSSGNHVSSSQQGNEFNEDCRFQYVLAAATSIATKVNEETLTYLNQGQSYEIKLKKLGDLSAYRGKILKSTIRICFHERRLQYTEREQMLAWQRARPGERLLEVDVPLSYGLVEVTQPSSSGTSIEFMWDPTKEVGVYIKVNCISTEFTPKKHGGEKGVPFRVQVETRLPGGPKLHAASCQVKVFKLKGADRKHKQDRDKIMRRPLHEQDKYQPSYDCTVLSDIPLDSLAPVNPLAQNSDNYSSSDSTSPQASTAIGINASPVPTPLALSINRTGIVPLVPQSDTLNGDIGNAPALPSPKAILPDQSCLDNSNGLSRRKSHVSKSIECVKNVGPSNRELPADASAAETSAWLRSACFHTFESTFASFSAADILRLSRDDLIQICGLADGIRLFNALHSKALIPKLTLYFSLEGNGSVWRVIYLDSLNSICLTTKLLQSLDLPHDRLQSLLLLGPQGIHVLVTSELVANMKDESMYFVETIRDLRNGSYKLLLKPSMR